MRHILHIATDKQFAPLDFFIPIIAKAIEIGKTSVSRNEHFVKWWTIIL